MTRYNDKDKIRKHYDRVSPYYHALWGEHLHHGFWIDGTETKEKAQIQLVEHLAEVAEIRPGARILDVGCGFGGSSIYLAKHYRAQVTGITISPIQVEMASKAAAAAQADATFLLMDAEAMSFNERFDVIWSIESISHYQETEKFFASAAKLIKPNGTLAITDWFKKEKLTNGEYNRFLQPIEKGMLVELQSMEGYEKLMSVNGLAVQRSHDVSNNCAKTWDVCLDIIKNRALWKLAASHGSEFLDFLTAFKAMRAGFASGSFVYGLMVARKT
jgi:tocopherol O-methyltransferase